ncbi:hypothetical protein AB5I41_05775 [Sphingomonas sp. MMS24-JH45]
MEPSIDTSVDILASYFKEDDNRLRIQKQLCQMTRPARSVV